MMSLYEQQFISDKIDLPLYDFVSPIEATHLQQVKTDNTEELLMEFDSIYDAVELTHLTPPQTPPQQYQQQQVNYSQHQYVAPDARYQPVEQNQFMYNNINCNNVMQSAAAALSDQEISIIFDNNGSSIHNNNNTANVVIVQCADIQAISSSDIAREMEVVDELVRSRSQNLPNWTDDDCTSESSSSGQSPRSEGTSSVFSQDDDDWANQKKYKSSSTTSKASTQLAGVTKKRTRPYARGSDDKKSRKKEQNKNAATRYRQKKKQEVEVILDEERILLNENQKLFGEYKDKRREVNYLKGLLRELFKAKGIIQ